MYFMLLLSYIHQLISIFYRNFNVSIFLITFLFYFFIIMILYSAMSNDDVGMALYKN